MKEGIKLRGKVTIRDTKTGKILYEKDNLVVNTGLSWLVDRMASNTAVVLSHIAVGTSNVLPTSTDSTLGAEILRLAMTDTDTIDNVYTAKTEFAEYQANVHWYEAGMFNDPTIGVMFNRVNIDFDKTAADSVEVEFTVTLSNS